MKEPKVKSLAKAMRVLECFKANPELGVTEISERLGLFKSNVFDILSTFQSLGYVAQNERNGKYHLGYKVLELSHVITAYMGFRKTVYPHMQQLAQEIGETVYLAIPDGVDVLYLDAAYPGHAYATRAMLGERAPMYCTGLGKALLSRMDPVMWQCVAERPLTAFTDTTISDRDALFCELALTRERGYSIDNMEHEHGVKCVGVAVVNDLGQPVAALSVSGPSPRLDADKVDGYAARLIDIAARIGVYF
ncbi:MAG: IclR family transcriptional regulator [Clostridiales bacterium]|nr:IclR family transcriptional regulator [Clostridiales bacterium]